MADGAVRGEPLPVRRVEGVWALCTRGNRVDPIPQEWGERISPSELAKRGWSPDEHEFEALAHDGWVLFALNEAARPQLDKGVRLLNGASLARAYVTDDGRLALSPGRLLAMGRYGWSPARIEVELEKEGLRLSRRFASTSRIVLAAHEPTKNPIDLCERLLDRGFRAAEPEFRTTLQPLWRPNDPKYDEKQWFWRNTGQTPPGGTQGVDVNAERAWWISRGRGAVIALIDSGFDGDHEDLRRGVHPNSGYFSQSGVTTSFNSATNTTFGTATSHGTPAAGIAGARANNRRGGCGMAPEADLLLVALGGLSSAATMARALEYCADPTNEVATACPDDGADVVSCSLKTPLMPGGTSRILMRSALRFVGRHGRQGRGALITWAAPNAAGSIDADPVYRSQYVTVISKTDAEDKVATVVTGSATIVNQATGKKLDFVAPGYTLYSTWPGSYYGNVSGTSYATPLVAGLAALCVAVNPQLKSRHVYKLIRSACEKVGTMPYSSGRNDAYGYGRVNAGDAVAQAWQGLNLAPWP